MGTKGLKAMTTQSRRHRNKRPRRSRNWIAKGRRRIAGTRTLEARTLVRLEHHREPWPPPWQRSAGQAPVQDHPRASRGEKP